MGRVHEGYAAMHQGFESIERVGRGGFERGREMFRGPEMVRGHEIPRGRELSTWRR